MNNQELIREIYSLNLTRHAVNTEKYIYDDMPKKLLNDMFARLLADKKTGVVSVYFRLSDKLNEKKSPLTKIYVCTKNNCSILKTTRNLHAYCSNINKSDYKQFKFMSESFKNELAKKLKKLGKNNIHQKIMSSKTNSKKRVVLHDKDLLIELINEIRTINLDELRIHPNDDPRTREKKAKKLDTLNSLIILLFDLIAIPTIFNHYITKPELNKNSNTSKESFIECYDQHTDQPEDQQWHPDSLLAHKVHENVDAMSRAHNNYLGVSFLPCLFCSIFLDTFNFDYRGRPETLYSTWRFPPNTETRQDLNVNFTQARDKIINNEPLTHLRAKTFDPCLVSTQNLYCDDICHLVNFFYGHHNNNRVLASFKNQVINNFLELIIDLKRIRDITLDQNRCVDCLRRQLTINNNNRLQRRMSHNGTDCHECINLYN